MPSNVVMGLATKHWPGCAQMSEADQHREMCHALFLTQVQSWDDTLVAMTNMWEIFEDQKDGKPIQFARVNPEVVVMRTPLKGDGSVDPSVPPEKDTFILLEHGDYAADYARRSSSSYRGWGNYRGGNWS